jgi:hypothetical protein
MRITCSNIQNCIFLEQCESISVFRVILAIHSEYFLTQCLKWPVLLIEKYVFSERCDIKIYI